TKGSFIATATYYQVLVGIYPCFIKCTWIIFSCCPRGHLAVIGGCGVYRIPLIHHQARIKPGAIGSIILKSDHRTYPAAQIGRCTEPVKVASTIFLLVSDKSAFINLAPDNSTVDRYIQTVFTAFF